MIEIQNERPKNPEHFSNLLAFCKEVVAICSDLDIIPVLNGSLAVFGYTQSQVMRVNDIDLACSELEFPRLSRALDTHGITHELKQWHVLQTYRDALKVEFDSMEYWMTDLPANYDTLVIDGYAFKVVRLASLKELYRRGLQATAQLSNEHEQAKYVAIAQKYEALCSVQRQGDFG
jgi:hypothetical protein